MVISNDYLLHCEYFRIQPLSTRRNIADVVYFHKILAQKINCTQLVSENLLYAPERPSQQNAPITFYVTRSQNWSEAGAHAKCGRGTSMRLEVLKKQNITKFKVQVL